MSTGDSLPARAWLVVGLLWVAAFLNYLDRNMILTMRVSVKEAIPMTEAQFGLLTSVFLWVYAGLSPLGGYLADRLSRRWVIIGSLFVWSSVTWLTGLATSFHQLLFARALMGISEACYMPAAVALIADYHRGPTRSRATGVHLTGFMAGAGMGGIGGWLAEHHGWNRAFLLFGCIGVAHSLLMYFCLRDTPREGVAAGTHSGSFLHAVGNLLRNRPFMILVAIWGLLGIAGWAIAGWLPTYFLERFQLTQTRAGFSATFYLAIASVLGALLGGAWADRWSRSDARGRIFVPMAGICLAAPGVFLLSWADSLPLAIFGVMLYGGRNFTDANMMPMLCLIVDPRYRATGYGLLNLVANGVGGLAIYLGGALRDAHVAVHYIYRGAAFGVAVCFVLYLLVKRSVAPIKADPLPPP